MVLFVLKVLNLVVAAGSSRIRQGGVPLLGI